MYPTMFMPKRLFEIRASQRLGEIKKHLCEVEKETNDRVQEMEKELNELEQEIGINGNKLSGAKRS